MRKLKLNTDSVKVQTLEMAQVVQIPVLPEVTAQTQEAASGCNSCWTSQAICF